jgi:hypothetical protein
VPEVDVGALSWVSNRLRPAQRCSRRGDCVEPAKSAGYSGAAALTGFAFLIAFNQVAIKIGSDGLQQVFAAALASALLGDQVGPSLLFALALSAAGLLLMNRPANGFRSRRRFV